MKYRIQTLAFIAVLSVFLFACDEEDPGPLQEATREFSVLDFDQLEMGSAFNIRVEEGNTFRVRAKGDRRNLNDLEVFKRGSTLIIQYDKSNERKHTTYITIQMPRLTKVNFSGASVSVIEDFESDDQLDVVLSGASVCQLDVEYRKLKANVSGASTLKLFGIGNELIADVSGASKVSAFDYPVRSAEFILTGASQSRTTVSDELVVTASGASMLTYRGNPSLDSTVSGESRVVKD